MSIAEIVREFLDKYDRRLVGTVEEERLVKQLEKIQLVSSSSCPQAHIA